MAEKKKPPKVTGTEPPTEAIALPIEWHFPEGLAGQYANHLVIQSGEHECHLSFFEIRPPLIFGGEEEIKNQLQETKTVRAECVARIIVTKERLKSFTDALLDVQNKLASKDLDKSNEKGN